MSFWPLIVYKTIRRTNQIPLIAKNSSFIIITPVRDKIFMQRYRNSSNYTNLKRVVCLFNERYEGYEGTKSNIPLQEIIYPRPKYFSLYESYYSILHILHQWQRRRLQVCHFRLANDTLRHQKQYVYDFQFSKYCINILIFHLNILRIVRKQGECFAYCRKWCTFAWIL